MLSAAGRQLAAFRSALLLAARRRDLRLDSCRALGKKSIRSLSRQPYLKFGAVLSGPLRSWLQPPTMPNSDKYRANAAGCLRRADASRNEDEKR
jgi:hypothetical protein